jgi:hypothetical protein
VRAALKRRGKVSARATARLTGSPAVTRRLTILG